MTDELNLIPYNVDAEAALLAGIVRNNKEIPSVVALLKPSDFFNQAHQAMYQAVLSLTERNDPIDPLTLINELRLLGTLAQAGDEEAVYNLLQVPMATERLEVYARIVLDTASRRRLIWSGEQIAKMARDNAPLDKIRERGEQWLVQATPTVGKTTDHISAGLEEALVYLDQIENGESDLFLPAMLHDVEKNLGGYTRGELTVYANFTGNGKTAWGLQEALDKGRRGFGVLYVSIEVYRKTLIDRIISQTMQMNLTQVQRGWREQDVIDNMPYGCPDRNTFWDKYREGHRLLEDLPIHFMVKSRDPKTGYVTSPTFTPSNIRMEIRNYATKHKIDFVILDYITKMEMPSGKGSSDRSLIVEHGLDTVRAGINDIGAAGLAFAQYSREANKSEEPRLHHLEQSTGIEKGSDNVWLAYSPDDAHEELQAIIGGKGRNRGKSVVEGLHFNGYIQTFTDNYIRQIAATSRFQNQQVEEW